MDGTVYKRALPSGRITWTFEINVGKDANGKQIRIRKGGFERKGDAEAEKTRRLQGLNDGNWVRPSPISFGDFLAEWLREHAEQFCSPKTVERYSQLAAYIVPTLGRFQLREISPLMLERVYNELRKSGGRGRGKRRGSEHAHAPLSVKTVRHIAGLVHVALATAVRWKLIRTNPAGACVLPELVKQEAVALDPGQTEWYLDAARGTFMYPILALAAATGCRRGELLALTWPDLSLESEPPEATISKSLEQTKAGLRIKPPKNNKTRRLPLPAFAVEVLRVHKREEHEKRNQFRNDYRADLNLVFAEPDGSYLKPDSVTARACVLAKRVGLRRVSLHTLRHSHGSQLLAEGVPLPVVSRRLGHSSVAVTAAIYSHPFTRDEIAAAEVWDLSMRKAVEAAQKNQQ